jgi:hypothetical protein
MSLKMVSGRAPMRRGIIDVPKPRETYKSPQAYFPPSIEIVCPLIQPACSEAKNKTPLAMSCGVPKRLRAMFFSKAACPASPMASHCLSVFGLERTNPGAMQLTGPEGQAVVHFTGGVRLLYDVQN